MLRPGGFLFGTYDVLLSNFQTLSAGYAAEHEFAGLTPGPPSDFDWSQVLLENPASVMVNYMCAQPTEDRQFWGHFGTIFTAATKD